LLIYFSIAEIPSDILLILALRGGVGFICELPGVGGAFCRRQKRSADQGQNDVSDVQLPQYECFASDVQNRELGRFFQGDRVTD
jgi:hypothetical protein